MRTPFVRALVLSIVFAAMLGAVPAGMPTHAQFGIPVGIPGTSLSLSSSPEHPAPNSSVRLSLQSVFLDLADSNITWYANDAVIAEGIGLRETSLITGSLGSETRIRVEVAGQDGTATATGTLRPTEVDLLWEADSYVPPFYNGRALPSPGSNVRLFAIPRFQRAGASSTVSPDELIYTWKKNGRVVQAVSGRGKHTVVMESPVLFGTDTVSVEARTSDGVLRGSTSVRIASVEPVLSLYENHPVFGILYHRALQDGSVVSETEAVFTAVPYFVPARTPDNSALVYEWSINGTPIANDPRHPSSITINAEGSSGLAQIALALTHATNFFLSASSAWSVTLSGTGQGSIPDLFGVEE
ncbi:hypothetical protein C4556_01465 [Candidatus Parcubacteria bacterium]|nr:MAG: hypothetical protein C4556_01465 [Candidatus Parcubacteria bacterium]